MFGAYSFGGGYFGQAPPGLVTRVAIGLAHGSSTALAVSLRLLDTATVSAATRRAIPNMSRVPGRAAELWSLRRSTRLYIETGDWRY
jgi:hypothetical protein